jgi:uncharacterized coiled-coil DUF342 family protein
MSEIEMLRQENEELRHLLKEQLKTKGEHMKTKEEYNQMYGQLCAEIGDKVVAIENANQQIITLKKKIVELAAEASAAAKSESPSNP